MGCSGALLQEVRLLAKGHNLVSYLFIDFVGEQIARFKKKPQYLEFVQAMPLSENGSINCEIVKELCGG